ncbi:MAG: TadE/TadG family type IV pilus assembly protein [Acidimicrobiia bacterium]
MREDERGITLTGLAVVLPIVALALLLLTEGVWAYAQRSNLEDGAAEGARLAAANFGTPAQVGQQVCHALDLEFGAANPRVTFTPRSGEGSAGAAAEITVRRSVDTLTGLLEGVFIESGLSATVPFTLAESGAGVAQWWNDGQPSSYVCPEG